jgi:PAS domain S-box-containing protein
LCEADDLFRGLLEAAPDAMVIVDGGGRIVLVNAQAEALFGYPRAELLGRSVELLLPERSRCAHLSHRIGYARAPRPRAMGRDLELSGRRKDGSEFPAEISLSPMQTRDGTLISSAIRDITERKRTEAALRNARDAAEAANRELETFSYSVAHDLRAPLRAIKGFSEVLVEDHVEQLDGEARDHLQRIQDAAGRMAQLIDALLGLARISRAPMSGEPVDLGELAHEVLAQLRAAEPRRVVKCVVGDGLVGRGDPRLLRVLLDNLLGNAWKFASKRDVAAIEVGVTQDRDDRVFFVCDNGVGFDMSYADRLFTPFQRLHSPSDFAGTGIGLATAQRIVRRHGGRIWAEAAMNRGATFYFTLDAAHAQDGAECMPDS